MASFIRRASLLTVFLTAAISSGAPIEKGIDPTSLKFSAADVKDRFTAFDKVAREFAGRDFDYRPYQLGGNFMTAVWHKGTGPTVPIVLKGDRAQLKPVHRIKVDAIVLPAPDQAMSAGLTVETVEADPEKWCLTLHFRQGNANPLTSEGWGIEFYRWNPAEYATIPFRPRDHVKELITIPSRLDYGGYDGSAAPLPRSKKSLNEAFVSYAISAEALRDTCLAELDRVEKFALTKVEEHKLSKLEYEKQGPPNLPPLRRSVPLTAADEKIAIAKVKEYYGSQRALIREHYKTCYAALRKSFPLEKVWPELAVK